MTAWLSDHFALEELTVTRHAKIDNTPPAGVVEALKDTAHRMEGVRAALGGHPITVTSGYRCAALNKAVGGAKASAHLTGRAVDFLCLRFGDPLAICRAIVAAGLAFDQLIEEGAWVHISFEAPMRGQVLTKVGDRYAKGLPVKKYAGRGYVHGLPA